MFGDGHDGQDVHESAERKFDESVRNPHLLLARQVGQDTWARNPLTYDNSSRMGLPAEVLVSMRAYVSRSAKAQGLPVWS